MRIWGNGSIYEQDRVLEFSERCEYMVFDAVYEYVTPIFNVYELELYMKKNDYGMMVRVWEKQKNGDRLFKNEINWKKKYNKSREESVTDEDGVKVTRYKPSWVKSVIQD